MRCGLIWSWRGGGGGAGGGMRDKSGHDEWSRDRNEDGGQIYHREGLKQGQLLRMMSMMTNEGREPFSRKRNARPPSKIHLNHQPTWI